MGIFKTPKIQSIQHKMVGKILYHPKTFVIIKILDLIQKDDNFYVKYQELFDPNNDIDNLDDIALLSEIEGTYKIANAAFIKRLKKIKAKYLSFLNKHEYIFANNPKTLGKYNTNINNINIILNAIEGI